MADGVRHRTWQSGALAACLTAAVLLAGGCSSSDGIEESSPYAAEFEQAIAQADSDYVRAALADGQVTAAEVQDARDHAVECMRQAGITAAYRTDEYGQTSLTTAELTPALSEAERSCGDQWVGSVEELYTKTTVNPDNADWDELEAACLVRKGLAPSGFTGQDLKELRQQGSVTVTAQPGESQTSVEPVPAATLPGGASLDAPEAIRCLVDPSA